MDYTVPLSLSNSKRVRFLSLALNLSFLLLICLYLHLYSSHPQLPTRLKKSNFISFRNKILDTDVGCRGLSRLKTNQEKCSYVKSQGGCQLGGYISYLHFFYCDSSPFAGYTVLLLWLLLLFYLLGDTASNYFCSSLEWLSRVLKLSPNVAGVTLLSLGNGAPDLCASLAAFTAEGTNEVGLSSILGGTFFVTTAVVGIISLINGHGGVAIDRTSFIRNIVFYLFSLLCLLLIVVAGRINFWAALSYLSIYVVYVLVVSAAELCRKETEDPILPLTEEDSGAEAPLLVDKPRKWNPTAKSQSRFSCEKFVHILELPLSLPRRLTIPVVSADGWSKPYAVISVAIAPFLLSLIWIPTPAACAGGILAGLVLGLAVFLTTEASNPPTKCLVPWLAGGFIMSITWTYIAAEELVSLLVSLGLILGISPSVLGLTVLSWGNSLGDLVADLTLARSDDPDGLEIAMAGCYAGPIFNTVASLGLSLAIASWKVYPNSYGIPTDSSVYVAMGFIVGGLLWALAVLPHCKMRMGRLLGVGLLAIYVCFLSLKVASAFGVLSFGLYLPGT